MATCCFPQLPFPALAPRAVWKSLRKGGVSPITPALLPFLAACFSFLVKRECLPPGKKHPFWLKPAGFLLLLESLNSEILAVFSWKSYLPHDRRSAVYSQRSDPVRPAHLFSSPGTHSPTVCAQLGILHVDLEQNERLHEKPGDAPWSLRSLLSN